MGTSAAVQAWGMSFLTRSCMSPCPDVNTLRSHTSSLGIGASPSVNRISGERSSPASAACTSLATAESASVSHASSQSGGTAPIPRPGPVAALQRIPASASRCENPARAAALAAIALLSPALRKSPIMYSAAAPVMRAATRTSSFPVRSDSLTSASIDARSHDP